MNGASQLISTYETKKFFAHESGGGAVRRIRPHCRRRRVGNSICHQELRSMLAS